MSKAAKLKARRKALKARAAGVSGKGHISLAPGLWDHGADGQANRRGLVVEERGEIDAKTGKMQNPNGVTGARRVDMLEIYHRRGVISDRGYVAGKVLREAWLRTEMGACSPFAREAVDNSLKLGEIMSVMIDRISAFRKANGNTACGDEEVLSVVACNGVAVGAIARYRNVMHEVGIMHLRDALERLADGMEGVRYVH